MIGDRLGSPRGSLAAFEFDAGQKDVDANEAGDARNARHRPRGSEITDLPRGTLTVDGASPQARATTSRCVDGKAVAAGNDLVGAVLDECWLGFSSDGRSYVHAVLGEGAPDRGGDPGPRRGPRAGRRRLLGRPAALPAPSLGGVRTWRHGSCSSRTTTSTAPRSSSCSGMQPGLEVVGAVGTGRRGGGSARDLAPDVVVMDYRLPGLDGAAATRAVIASSGAAVVCLTAEATDDEREDILRAGAVALIEKGSPIEGLAAAIHAPRAVPPRRLDRLGFPRAADAWEHGDRPRLDLGLRRRARPAREHAARPALRPVRRGSAARSCRHRPGAVLRAARGGEGPADDVPADPGGLPRVLRGARRGRVRAGSGRST